MSATSSSSAMRKHLLVMRAAIERAELAETVQDVRHGLRWTTLLKGVVPGVAARQGLPLLAQLLRRFPVLSTAASVLVARLRPRISVIGLLRVAVIGGLLWQGWQLARGLHGAVLGRAPARKRQRPDRHG